MWRLLLDQLRRSAGAYVGSVAVIALIWVLPSGPFSARWVVAWSLVIAWFTGPIRSFAMTSAKEMALLPVSWRERWRAQWILAVIFPLVVIALGQALGMVVANAALLPPGNVDAFVLSLLCCAAYLGLAMGVQSTYRRNVAPLTLPLRPRNPRSVKLALVAALAPFTIVFVGGFSGAIFYSFMPNDLAALRGVAGGLIAAGISTGVWTWFYWSSLGPGPHLFARVPSGVRSATEAPSPLPREARGGGVLGLYEFSLLRACKGALVCAALALPFLFLMKNLDLVKIVWVTVVFFLGSVDWQPRLRQLRPLPISVSTLNLAMISTTAAVWIVTGLLMTAAAFVAPSKIDGLPFIRVFTVVMGVHVLLDSVRLRNKRSDLFIVAAVFGVQQFVPWHSLASLPVPLLVYGGSLAIIAAALLLNRHTLTRSHAAYKLPALPSRFGVPQPR